MNTNLCVKYKIIKVGEEIMSNNGKRLLASLMGVHLNEEAPQLESLVPQRISNQIMSGQLPKFNPSTIILGQNESCHFMDRAALAIKKTEKSYQVPHSKLYCLRGKSQKKKNCCGSLSSRLMVMRSFPPSSWKRTSGTPPTRRSAALC